MKTVRLNTFPLEVVSWVDQEIVAKLPSGVTAGFTYEIFVNTGPGPNQQDIFEVAIPEGAIVIDATGKHLTPGIIDCHSHMATDGGVNESAQAITAEVRIADFIDCNEIDI